MKYVLNLHLQQLTWLSENIRPMDSTEHETARSAFPINLRTLLALGSTSSAESAGSTPTARSRISSWLLAISTSRSTSHSSLAARPRQSSCPPSSGGTGASGTRARGSDRSVGDRSGQAQSTSPPRARAPPRPRPRRRLPPSTAAPPSAPAAPSPQRRPCTAPPRRAMSGAAASASTRRPAPLCRQPSAASPPYLPTCPCPTCR